MANARQERLCLSYQRWKQSTSAKKKKKKKCLAFEVFKEEKPDVKWGSLLLSEHVQLHCLLNAKTFLSQDLDSLSFYAESF